MEDLYTIVTIYQPDGASRPTVHSYGPYTQHQASYEQQMMKRDPELAPKIASGEFRVIVTRIQDPERRSKFIWARS